MLASFWEMGGAGSAGLGSSCRELMVRRSGGGVAWPNLLSAAVA